MKFNCKYCQSSLSAEGDQFGEVLPCPNCHREILVPLPAEKIGFWKSVQPAIKKVVSSKFFYWGLGGLLLVKFLSYLTNRLTFMLELEEILGAAAVGVVLLFWTLALIFVVCLIIAPLMIWHHLSKLRAEMYLHREAIGQMLEPVVRNTAKEKL